MIEDNSLGLEFKYLIVNDMDRKFGLWVNTVGYQSIPPDRSEERRVGKECRSRWSPYH